MRLKQTGTCKTLTKKEEKNNENGNNNGNDRFT